MGKDPNGMNYMVVTFVTIESARVIRKVVVKFGFGGGLEVVVSFAKPIGKWTANQIYTHFLVDFIKGELVFFLHKRKSDHPTLQIISISPEEVHGEAIISKRTLVDEALLPDVLELDL